MRGLDDSADDGGLGHRPADATRLECDLDNIGAMSDHPVYDLLRLRGCLDESCKPAASPLPGARGVTAWRGQDRTRDGDERTLSQLSKMRSTDCDPSTGVCCMPYDAPLGAAIAQIQARISK